MKTLKIVEITPVYMEEGLPEKDQMKPDTLYISEQYKGCSHLCLCGCGVECYLPLTQGQWMLTNQDGKVSLTPSILQRFDCRSHYIITKNKANFV